MVLTSATLSITDSQTEGGLSKSPAMREAFFNYMCHCGASECTSLTTLTDTVVLLGMVGPQLCYVSCVCACAVEFLLDVDRS